MTSRTMLNRFDVAVIGAGPAGSTAAFRLAKSGLKTLILEKETLPRYKACGGGLVYRTRSWLKETAGLELPLSLIESESFRAGFRVHTGNLMFKVQREVPVITMVMRERFDHWLTNQAVDQGAILIDNSRIISIRKDNAYSIYTSEDAFTASIVILATGALGKVFLENGQSAKLISGFNNYRDMMPAIEAEIPFNGVENGNLYPFAHFDLDMNNGGYGWVFPKKSSYSAGLVVQNKSKKNLNKLLSEYLGLLKLDSTRPSLIKGHCIPYQAWHDGNIEKGILKTGDAMGLADPVVGEGLSNAIRSGWLAAEAIIESGLDPGLSCKVYMDKLRINILPQLKIASRLAGMLYNQPRLSRMMFKTMGQEITENFTEIFLGNRNYPSEKEVFKVLRKFFFK